MSIATIRKQQSKKKDKYAPLTELAELIEPFGWTTYRPLDIPMISIAGVAAALAAPLVKELTNPFWNAIDLQELTRRHNGFGHVNQAKSLARALIRTRADLLHWQRLTAVGASNEMLRDLLSELPIEINTPSGYVFAETEETSRNISIWFLRKAEKEHPDLYGTFAIEAVRMLFSIPDDEEGERLGVSPPCQTCRVCGCTEDDCQQCINATGEPCHWVEKDLCSRCAAALTDSGLEQPARSETKRAAGGTKARSTNRRLDPAHHAPAADETVSKKDRGRKNAPADGSDSAKNLTNGVHKKSEAIEKTPGAPGKPDLKQVAIKAISPDPRNDRKKFDKEALQQLADSIKQHGILQPLLLRPDPNALRPHGKEYLIVAGERRYRAAQLAGLKEVPAQIVSPEALQTSLMRLEENIRREDLTPIERAQAIARMIEEHNLTQAEVGKRLGVQQGQISNELRLLKLPADWQKRVAAGEIAPTLARQLLPLTEYPQFFEALDKVIIAEEIPYAELTVDDLKEFMRVAVLECTRPMKFKRQLDSWSKPNSKDRHFDKCSPEDLQALNPVQFDFLSEYEGKERTFNLKLFHDLNKSPLQKRNEKHAAEKQKRNSHSSQPEKKKVALISQWGEYRIKSEIEDALNQSLRQAVAECKNAKIWEHIVLALTIAGNIDTVAGMKSMPTKYWQKLLAIAKDPKKLLPQLRDHYSKSKRGKVCIEVCHHLAGMLQVDLTQGWKPTKALLHELTPEGLQKCVDVIHECREFTQEATNRKDGSELKISAKPDAVLKAWVPGLIPEFLRPFFGLPKAKAKPKPAKKKATVA